MVNEEKNFEELAKEKFDALEKEENELKEKLAEVRKEIRPLRNYLIAAGVIPKGRRKRKAKSEDA